ncbi:hypothetical protein PPACK8108_LOCUS21115 [Phakopsora pachyrhizi]|uniref:Uncharacterized protein n=1 Tax=Phakopsora pachyrhizi TaxID=170000 RepID=A0AAV0BHW5_PHAPC|nr:hypothetical protein PPACK8108_LOCUS21115 [Phakopsora pachyrhizi]
MPCNLSPREQLAQTIRELGIEDLVNLESSSVRGEDILLLHDLYTKCYLVPQTSIKLLKTYSTEDLMQLSPSNFKQLTQTTHTYEMLSSAPDPEKGLNVIPIDYPVSNKPPPPQPLLAPLSATTNVKTTVPVQATAAGDGEKLPNSLIAFDDLNQFWTSSSNTDQESFNNQSLHSFTDPRRPEPIQPRQQRDLSKRLPQLFTSFSYHLSESDLINQLSSNPIYQDGMVLSISGGDGNNNLKERSSIDTFRTIQPSICNPIINNEFLTTTDQSQLSDNKNQTVFVETQGTNEEMLLFEQQVLNHQRSNKMKTNLH